jgi:hypothetical protein
MTQHKFAIGDAVDYTNDNGVAWGRKTVIGLDDRLGPCYYIEPTDTPWFSVRERNLTPHVEKPLDPNEGTW